MVHLTYDPAPNIFGNVVHPLHVHQLMLSSYLYNAALRKLD